MINPTTPNSFWKGVLLVFISIPSFGLFAQPGSGCTQGSSCPSDAAFVQPCDWGETDGGSPGCDANTWKHEDGTASDNGGGCQSFIDDNDCDLVIWTDPIDLNCNFCADFDIQIDAGDEGLAFTMVNTSNLGPNFPCSTPFACDGNGASDPSAVGGNLGWSPTFDDGGTAGGGAMTIEYDVQNNAPFDDDLVDGVYCPHVSINEDGCNDFALQSGCADGSGGLPDITDGATHSTSICWDPTCGELTVYIDGVLISSLQEDIRNYFATTEVYFAFSSGYSGGDGSVSTVCNFAVSAPASSCVVPVGTQGPEASNCAVLLPVELVSFEGTMVSDRTAQLTWSTISEEENDYFVIERSFDATSWEDIAKVAGSGNSLELQNYSYEDHLMMHYDENVYYRLSQVDYNGDRNVYDVISLDLTKASSIALFPVPSQSYVNVKTTQAITNLKLFSAVGAFLEGVPMDFIADNHALIHVKDLLPGVYFIEVDGIRRSFVVSAE